MKFKSQILVVGLAVLMVASAYGQYQGGGTYGGRGGRRGGGRSNGTATDANGADIAPVPPQNNGSNVRSAAMLARLNAYFAPIPMWQMIFQQDVQQELGIDPAAMREIGMAMIQSGAFKQPNASGDPEGAFKRLNLNQDEALKKTLNPTQRKRMIELYIQNNENVVVLDPEISKALGIQGQQRDDIKAIALEINKRLRVQNAKLEKGEEVKETLDMNAERKKANEAIGKLLTEAQKDQLVKMGGKEFHFTNKGQGVNFGPPTRRAPAGAPSGQSGSPNG